MNSTARKIIHIDMDAFYASVEQHDHPEFFGKPLVVGFSEGRGVIAAASYEARKYGIHSALPTRKALELCPHLIFAPPRFSRYREVSNAIRKIFHEYTELVEPLSLDEAYLDISHLADNFAEANKIALEIKMKIQNLLGLTASAGISYNKFLAKIASDVNKPNGIFLIKENNAVSFLQTLPIKDFYGVGKVTTKKMHELGIITGKELYQASEEFLSHHFGKAGKNYYYYARGIDHRIVDPYQPQKSLGVEETFFDDLTSKEEIIEELEIVAKELIKRSLKSQFIGRNCTLKLRYKDFSQVSKSQTLHFPLGESLEDLWQVTLLLLENIQLKPQKGIRLIGLTIANIDLEKDALNNELNQLQIPLS
ncbi:DNA polymerase IV [Ignatzschineria sp. LJL83]